MYFIKNNNMINIDTWFYFKSPHFRGLINSCNVNFGSINAHPIALEITDGLFKFEVSQIFDLNCLSESDKVQIIEKAIETISIEFNSNIPKALDEKVGTSFRKLLYESIFLLSSEKPVVDIIRLIEILKEINGEIFFYVDTYSILAFAKLFASRKMFYKIHEELTPSEFTRKKEVRNAKEANEIIQSKKTIEANKHSIEMVLFTEFIKNLFKSKEEQFLRNCSFTSETQALNMILKEMPERIITKEELINETITFRRTKDKDELLYKILQCLFPENKKYYSVNNYPLKQKTEFSTFVRSTITQKFY